VSECSEATEDPDSCNDQAVSDGDGSIDNSGEDVRLVAEGEPLNNRFLPIKDCIKHLCDERQALECIQ